MKRLISILLIAACLMTLLPVTASAKTGGKLIALTFDDGPCGYTAGLLDGLKERGVKVTFFMLGMKAKDYRETVRRMYTEGHQIAQHTYDHPTLSTKTDEQVRWQLDSTDDILNGHLGTNYNFLLRPPYGDYKNHTLDIIGKPAIFWSVDPLDWKYHNSDTVYNNIVSGAFDGAIILAHDIHATTIPGALRAVDTLLEQGYEFVTVNELFRRRGVSLENGKCYYSCKPTGTDLGPISAPTMTLKTSYGKMNARLSAQDGMDIYYTTDGSDPALNGTRYKGEFAVSVGTTVKAVAAKDLNGSRSTLMTEKIDGTPVKEPTFEVKDGKVVITNPNAGTDVRYTTDGSAPTTGSTVYSAPIACFDGVISYSVMGEGIVTNTKRMYVSKNGNLFRDVPHNEWYFANIDRAVSLGMLNGVAKYEYDPNGSLTRAMFVTMLYRVMQKLDTTVQPGKNGFSDVENGKWYTDAVLWAAKEDIVRGYPNGTFRPDQSINREEMCAMLNRAMKKWLTGPVSGELTFSDKEKISDWAKEDVRCMAAASVGLMQGMGNNRFAPQETATRAQAATVLLRLTDYCKKHTAQ